jgi:asparagine synthase (glutamine-hydrolysing)
MCGIAGLIGVRDEGLLLARRLLAGLQHRGPDDCGVEQPVATATLVQTRLAIIDLSPAGHQPMRDEPPQGLPPNWVVFNGEIYNYRELREELSTEGVHFRSRCDTEAILHAYRRWGTRCVEHLRGMFAICLVDTAAGLAHLWRDRLGIKPLYTCRIGSGLAFSSEVRPLLDLDGVARRVNPAALESFFAQGAVQGDDSIVAGVTMLRPASHLCVELESGREVSRRTYWHLSTREVLCTDPDAQIDGLRSIARETLREHLISDAPLGIFLSGGVDSAAVLTMASEVCPESLRTLTIGFDLAAADETAAARATARAFGVQHQVVRLSGSEVLAQIEPALAAADQPTVDGFNTYFVSRAAREAGLTVALSGLGADELFGGYASFAQAPWALKMRRTAPLRWGARFGAGMVNSRWGAKIGEAARRRADLLEMYLLRRELFLPGERRSLHDLPDDCEPSSGLQRSLTEELRRQACGMDEINQISLYEIQLYMRHMLLRDSDAFSMAAPIEYRVPFLDHLLVERVFALPGERKKPDGRPKPVLLEIAGPRLPDAVWKRPKRGFTFPWESWLGCGGALAPLANDAVHDVGTWRRLGLDAKAVAAIWKRFLGGDRRISALQILAFVTLRDFAARWELSRA